MNIVYKKAADLVPYENNPVNDEKNDRLYRNYKKLAEQDNLITVGRLSEFKYLNMDEAIENALKVAESICEKQ